MISTVLFFIVGWPIIEKVIGASFPSYCEHCHNENHQVLIKQRRWLSFFFIPLLPISRANYYLLCDVCMLSYEVDKEDVSKLKDMVEKTEKYTNGELTPSEYNTEIESYNQDQHQQKIRQ